jgi:hypothetical protein
VLAAPGAGAAAGGKGGSRDPAWDGARAAARRMVVQGDTPVEDAVQMLDCLDPALASDRQILDGIRSRSRPPLRDRAAEILDAAKGRARP